MKEKKQIITDNTHVTKLINRKDENRFVYTTITTTNNNNHKFIINFLNVAKIIAQKVTSILYQKLILKTTKKQDNKQKGFKSFVMHCTLFLAISNVFPPLLWQLK